MGSVLPVGLVFRAYGRDLRSRDTSDGGLDERREVTYSKAASFDGMEEHLERLLISISAFAAHTSANHALESCG